MVGAAFSIVVGYAEGKVRQLVCRGELLDVVANTRSPVEAAQLTLNSRREMVINLGQGAIDLQIIRHNKLSLEFKAKDLTGQFFPNTNRIYLIFNSGRIARLTCK